MRALCLLALVFVSVSGAQPQVNGTASGPSKAAALDENDFFRVSRMEIEPGKSATIGDRTRDLIIVPVAGGDLSATGTHSNTTGRLSNDEVRFEGRGTQIVVSNNNQIPARLIIADLQRHFDAEIRPCVEPHKCTHPIQTGPAQIGQSTLLFTSGFITAYSYRLDRGGTLASSYYSSNGKDHLLLIARTELQATFDGQEQQLLAGQVYTSDASQVEVSASTAEARWIVIRMQVPKHTE